MHESAETPHPLAQRPLLANVIVGIAHLLAAQLGLLLSHPETHVTLIWPPVGMALAAVLLLGYRVWPAILLGEITVAILEGHSPLIWAVGPVGNTLTAVVGAWVLQTAVDFDLHLRRIKDILWLALGGGLLSALIGATLGVAALTVTGRFTSQEALGSWLTWWLGDAISVTIITPLLLILGTKIQEKKLPSMRPEKLAAAAPPFALLLITCVVVFGGLGRFFPRRASLPVAFAVFPALVWIGMRFGVAGSSIAVVITAILGTAGTALGYGPFSGPRPQESLGVLWGFVGVAAFTALALGAAVSERLRAEEELALRRQLWDSLMANTPDLVYFKDADHGLIMASQAYADDVGREPDDLVGRTAAELWPREGDEIMADERRVLAGEPLIRKERQATTAAGEPRWYLLTKAPIYQDGEVIGFFAIDKDITERKQAEERLAFQSMLLDQIQDLVTATDLEGRITYVNEAECRAFGKSADELIGQSVAAYGEDPDRGATQQEIIDTTLATGKWRGQVVNVTAEGREIILDSRVQLLRDEDGQPFGLLGISSDITEQREMERQLRLQERLAAVGQLASGIAHDFRNLLTAIILYAGLPLRQHDLSPDLEQSLQTIIAEAEKATDLVQQILDFSSRAMIERQPLDAESIVGDVLAVLRRILPETIHITLQAGRGPYVIEADSGRLHQALMNLATNARDAMPGGGQLRFELSHLQLEAQEAPPITVASRSSSSSQVRGTESGSWICLSVSDTGTGMSEEVQDHLFEPFFTTKEVGQGTGLGLAQVYGIVRQHEGAIDVETEPGEGTTFHLFFPAYEGAEGQFQEEEGARSPTARHGQGETILLVEDEENVRRAACELLENLGYDVLSAANGHEALTLCQSPRWCGGQSAIDLVITDLVMPKMGGEELLQRLRAARPDLKVLGITGYGLKEGDVECLKERGFADVIRKPFKIDAMAQAVERALNA